MLSPHSVKCTDLLRVYYLLNNNLDGENCKSENRDLLL